MLIFIIYLTLFKIYSIISSFFLYIVAAYFIASQLPLGTYQINQCLFQIRPAKPTALTTPPQPNATSETTEINSTSEPNNTTSNLKDTSKPKIKKREKSKKKNQSLSSKNSSVNKNPQNSKLNSGTKPFSVSCLVEGS